ncbi:MAG TPA: hypothetical protein VFX95_04515, partial [Caulobacteraceae bacterium]|nr:hypothetical protein [Caulobacteraceae bacterium]
MIKVLLAFVGAMVLAMSPQSSAAAPPLSAYGALPAIEDVTISRDGSQLAYITVSGERRTLVAQTLDGRALGLVNVGDAKVHSLQWAGPDDLIIVTSATGSSEYFLGRHEWLFATSYNLPKRRFLDLAGHIPDTMNTILSVPAIRFVNGKWVAVISTVSVKESGIVLREASLQTPHARVLDVLHDRARSWLLDQNGVLQAQTRYDEHSRTWSLHVRQGAGWPSVYEVKADLDTPSLVSFGRDGKSPVLAVKSDESDVRFIEITQDGAQRPAMPADHEFRDVLVDPLTRRLIGGVYHDEYLRYLFFDAKEQAAWDRIVR